MGGLVRKRPSVRKVVHSPYLVYYRVHDAKREIEVRPCRSRGAETANVRTAPETKLILPRSLFPSHFSDSYKTSLDLVALVATMPIFYWFGRLRSRMAIFYRNGLGVGPVKVGDGVGSNHIIRDPVT